MTYGLANQLVNFNGTSITYYADGNMFKTQLGEAFTTNFNGEVTDIFYYDSYGSMVSRTCTTGTPFLYVGQYGVEIDDSGLYYMRARYYNLQMQRFINVDPVRDNNNWYAYSEKIGILPDGSEVNVSHGSSIEELKF